MGQGKYLFFTRIAVVALLYYVSNKLAEFDFLMDFKIFPLILVLYLLCAIINPILSDKKSAIVKISSDVLFIMLFCAETCFYAYWMHRSPGEAGWGFWAIMMYTPMFALFAAWLVWDIKKLGKLKDVETME